MKTKTKEIVIKSIAKGVFYIEPNDYKPCYVYEIETSKPLNLNALEHVITETEKIPERLDEFMVLHGIGQSEILEFLNKNYKSE